MEDYGISRRFSLLSFVSLAGRGVVAAETWFSPVFLCVGCSALKKTLEE